MFFCCLLLLFTACSKDYVTGKSSYNWFNVDQDVKLGKQVLSSQLNALQGQKYKGEVIKVDADEQQLARLKNMVDRIGKVSHLPNLPYEVHLAEVPIVNAWAAPGGKMMVYSGLWDPKEGLVNKDDDNELAAVLSHEISHATARHVTETLSTLTTIQLGGIVASSAIGAAGSGMGQNLFGQFFSQGFQIFVPTYTRKNESEADRVGLFYMAKAGYDPRAAVRVWQRAAKKRGDATSIYASHPSSGERAKALEKLLPLAMEIYEHPEKPYPNFKDLGKNQAKKAKAATP
jgi:predicted Zn-dependent protease